MRIDRVVPTVFVWPKSQRTGRRTTSRYWPDRVLERYPHDFITTVEAEVDRACLVCQRARHKVRACVAVIRDAVEAADQGVEQVASQLCQGSARVDIMHLAVAGRSGIEGLGGAVRVSDAEGSYVDPESEATLAELESFGCEQGRAAGGMHRLPPSSKSSMSSILTFSRLPVNFIVSIPPKRIEPGHQILASRVATAYWSKTRQAPTVRAVVAANIKRVRPAICEILGGQRVDHVWVLALVAV